MSDESRTHAALRHAEQGASTGVKWAARIGYAARGVVYLVIGGLAFLAAIGPGGQTTGSKGALASLRDEPFGQAILIAMAIGLVCFAIWRAVEAIRDPDHHGHDAKGVAVRLGEGISAITHTFLAIYAASLAFGWGGGGGDGGNSAQSRSGWLMSQPFGQWILGAIGLAIIGVGIGQIIRGYKEKYHKYLRMDYQTQRWADPVCKAGLYARGVVFGIIGIMLVVAAWRHDMFEAGGLGEALRVLQNQPYGWLLLGVVALGLIAFGFYSFIEARYRRIRTT